MSDQDRMAVAVVEAWPDDNTRLGIVPLVSMDDLPEGTRLYTALAQQAVPEGWKPVPVDPTDAMRIAGGIAHESSPAHDVIGPLIDAWAAMLSAAPAAPRAEQQNEPDQAALAVVRRFERMVGDYNCLFTEYQGKVMPDHIYQRFVALRESRIPTARNELAAMVSKALATQHAEPLTSQATAVGAEPFQQRVQPWLLACFGAEISADKVERNHRFLEEALELVQACGCTQSEAHQLVDYVFGRPVGEPAQEVGGVMVTLAALCLAQGMDMHAAGETELARIWTKVEAIRAKQAAKPKHSPLPAHPPVQPQAAPRTEQQGIPADFVCEFLIERAWKRGYTYGRDAEFVTDEDEAWGRRAADVIAEIEDLAAPQADNWRQYATERETTAQQVIERHRAEHGSLLRLLAKDRATIAELRAQQAGQAPAEGAGRRFTPAGFQGTDLDYAGWLADKLPNTNDYGKEAALLLVKQAEALAATSSTQPKGMPFLARDVAELLGIGVPELGAALVALGFPQRSQGMTIEPLEALAVYRAQAPAPAQQDIGPDSENYAGDEAPLPADVPYPPSLDNVTIYNPYGPMSMDPTDGQPVQAYWDRAGLRDYGARCIAWAAAQAPAVAHGHKVTPYEPTQEMIGAVKRFDPALPLEHIRAIWWAMWGASKPPVQGIEKEGA